MPDAVQPRQATLARAVRLTAPLASRFFVGFGADTATAQVPGLPNHMIWNLGHLALTMHRAIEKLDASPPPESDFLQGDGRSGGPARFDTESVCFGSTPAVGVAHFHGVASCSITSLIS